MTSQKPSGTQSNARLSSLLGDTHQVEGTRPCPSPLLFKLCHVGTKAQRLCSPLSHGIHKSTPPSASPCSSCRQDPGQMRGQGTRVTKDPQKSPWCSPLPMQIIHRQRYLQAADPVIIRHSWTNGFSNSSSHLDHRYTNVLSSPRSNFSEGTEVDSCWLISSELCRGLHFLVCWFTRLCDAGPHGLLSDVLELRGPPGPWLKFSTLPTRSWLFDLAFSAQLCFLQAGGLGWKQHFLFLQALYDQEDLRLSSSYRHSSGLEALSLGSILVFHHW